MQDQAEDRGLAGLARSRPVAARPTASADPAILAPVPAPLDCPFLDLGDDRPTCLALPPAIRLSRRQVEIVCAVESHVACPRHRRADAGRGATIVEPPARTETRRRGRSTGKPTERVGPADDVDHGAVDRVAVADLTAAPSAGPAVSVEGPAAPVVEGAALPVEPGAASIPEPVETGASAVPAVDAPLVGPASAPGSAIVPEPGGSPAAASARGPARPPAEPPQRPPRAPAPRLASLVGRPAVAMRRATAVAWLILAGTLVLVIALLTVRGGLTLPPAATPSAGAVLATPGASASTAAASPSPSPSPTPSPSPSPSTPASSTPSPTVSPGPSSSPSASPPFPPDRMALLKACPGVAGCYQYRIKSRDNLHNVATFFGVTYQALLAANPQITNPSVIHVGDPVIIPLPTP